MVQQSYGHRGINVRRGTVENLLRGRNKDREANAISARDRGRMKAIRREFRRMWSGEVRCAATQGGGGDQENSRVGQMSWMVVGGDVKDSRGFVLQLLI